MSKYVKVSIIAVLCLIFFAGCSIGKTAETTPQTTEEETYYFDPTDMVDSMDMLGGSPEEEVVIGEVEVDVGVYGDEGIVGDDVGEIGIGSGGGENVGDDQEPQIIVTEPPMETVPDLYE